jgi:RNA polymerase sigma-70 factor (ECF subfamily)
MASARCARAFDLFSMPSHTTTLAAPAEEAHLLGLVAAGDHGTPLVDLYRRYSPRLYGLGLRLTGDSGMAEELVQETFLRLWRGAQRFDPERGSVRTYIFTIARRAAVDLLRRSASRPLPTGHAADRQLDLLEGEAFDALVLGLDVREAVSALSSKHREVLELMVDEDLGQAEIAQRLRVPLGTVKTRAFYGLRALKLELEERGLLG